MCVYERKDDGVCERERAFEANSSLRPPPQPIFFCVAFAPIKLARCNTVHSYSGNLNEWSMLAKLCSFFVTYFKVALFVVRHKFANSLKCNYRSLK